MLYSIYMCTYPCAYVHAMYMHKIYTMVLTNKRLHSCVSNHKVRCASVFVYQQSGGPKLEGFHYVGGL